MTDTTQPARKGRREMASSIVAREAPKEVSASMAIAACGHAADATRETMPATIFYSSVADGFLKALGPSAGSVPRSEWLRAPEQRARIGRAWSNGESVWMVAQTLCLMWRGFALSQDDGDRTAIRAAWRNRMERE